MRKGAFFYASCAHELAFVLVFLLAFVLAFVLAPAHGVCFVHSSHPFLRMHVVGKF